MASATMAKVRRLLLLGGTGEALRLARELEGNDRLHCISSLAGRTEQPVQPPGAVRVGGFGGIAGLSDYLVREKSDLVQIGIAACRARVCQSVSIPVAAVSIKKTIKHIVEK